MIDTRAETYSNASGKGEEVFVSLKQTSTKSYRSSKTTMKVLCVLEMTWLMAAWMKWMVFTKQARIPRHPRIPPGWGPQKPPRPGPRFFNNFNSYTAAMQRKVRHVILQVRSLCLQLKFHQKKSTKKDSGQNSCLVGGFNPFGKIFSSNWIISPGIGMKIKHNKT